MSFYYHLLHNLIQPLLLFMIFYSETSHIIIAATHSYQLY